jgi:hypothetical protein
MLMTRTPEWSDPRQCEEAVRGARRERRRCCGARVNADAGRWREPPQRRLFVRRACKRRPPPSAHAASLSPCPRARNRLGHGSLR